MGVLSRVEAGHYTTKDQAYTLKRSTDVYRCKRGHKYRGEYCHGNQVHLVYVWSVIFHPTGEILGEYRTKQTGQRAIERHQADMSNALQAAREAAKKSEGRKFLPLPAGVNNYEIASLKMEQDMQGRKYLNLHLKSSAGSGFHRLYLEPMSAKHERFLEFFIKDIEALGFDTTKYDDELLVIRDFIRYAPSLKGKIVEAFVKHSDYTDNNGDKRTRAGVFFNGLTDTGAQQDDLFDDGNTVSILEDEFNAVEVSNGIDDEFVV